MTIVALYSNKGGVGKTTTAVNLSYLAAQSGIRTLTCDLDPQSSATYYFRVKPKIKKGAKGFLKWGMTIDRSIKGTDYENLDLLPADFSHRNLDIIFANLKRSRSRLEKIMQPLESEYDLIFVDSPPLINILAENIFNTADYLLVPLIPTTLSVRSHEQLLVFLDKAKYDLRRVYSFISMVDKRKKMHREIAISIYKHFDNVLRSPIPFLSLVERMGSEREPVPAFAPNSRAAIAYIDLWEEIQELI